MDALQTSPVTPVPLARFPGPIDTDYVSIPRNASTEYKSIEYPDCVENAVLRFLHLALWNASKDDVLEVDIDRLVELGASDELVAFFSEHPSIRPMSWYSGSPDGLTERNRWALLLARIPGVRYVRHGAFEVDSTPSNFYAIVRHFFPRVEDSVPTVQLDAGTEEHAAALGVICAFFSSPKLALSFSDLCVAPLGSKPPETDSTDTDDTDGTDDTDDTDDSDSSSSDAGPTECHGMLYRGVDFSLLVNGERLFKWSWYEYVEPGGGVTEEGHSELIDLRPPHSEAAAECSAAGPRPSAGV